MTLIFDSKQGFAARASGDGERPRHRIAKKRAWIRFKGAGRPRVTPIRANIVRAHGPIAPYAKAAGCTNLGESGISRRHMMIMGRS